MDNTIGYAHHLFQKDGKHLYRVCISRNVAKDMTFVTVVPETADAPWPCVDEQPCLRTEGLDAQIEPILEAAGYMVVQKRIRWDSDWKVIWHDGLGTPRKEGGLYVVEFVGEHPINSQKMPCQGSGVSRDLAFADFFHQWNKKFPNMSLKRRPEGAAEWVDL